MHLGKSRATGAWRVVDRLEMTRNPLSSISVMGRCVSTSQGSLVALVSAVSPSLPIPHIWAFCSL